ncbi:MAG: 4-oxalocrotonate tautomerase [Pseudomonadota bacterium]
MPVLQLQMHPGRSLEQKRQFVEAVTRVACQTLACSPETVDVIISEVSRENWANNGKLRADPASA